MAFPFRATPRIGFKRVAFRRGAPPEQADANKRRLIRLVSNQKGPCGATCNLESKLKQNWQV